MALSSGRPPSGVAVLRVSGSRAAAVATAFRAVALAPRRAALRRILSPRDGTLLDHALCLWVPAPHSATGEDVLELHLHGGPALVDRVLADALTVSGVRLAEPGEFTLRAVLAGKMDLAAAEGLAELIEARTEGERRRATRLAAGALSDLLAAWRARILGLSAATEAAIDFADEGDVGGDAGEVAAAARGLARDIAAELARGVGAEKLTDGFAIALVGPPNAGKSSLFNALAGRAAAIVSATPGTTRDVVTVTLDLGGFRVHLHDTAGVRGGASGVEALGIARTEALRREADLVVEVRSADTAPLALPDAGLLVQHKSDLGLAASPGADIATSVSDVASIDALRDLFAARAAAALSRCEAALVTRARQRTALAQIVAALESAAAAPSLELCAEDLRHARLAMARLTGEIGIEDVLGEVFTRFCIGK